MRKLSKEFMTDLKTGILSALLERVKLDDTLMLAIRDEYINIYYRGGNLLKLERQGLEYHAFFDKEYNKSFCELPNLPTKVTNEEELIQWVNAIPALKEVMDFYFSGNRKAEREFQQLVARENNHSPISNESEYFILDIEFSDTDIGAKIDILAVYWGADDRKGAKLCKPVFIEMKYGDGALDGSSGIIKHLSDFEAVLANDKKRRDCLQMMEEQFGQLDDLGLIKYNQAKKKPEILFDVMAKPEVIFIFANHNPRKGSLYKILSSEAMSKLAPSESFDLKFYISSFAGYGMHADNMCSLDQMKKLLSNGVRY